MTDNPVQETPELGIPMLSDAELEAFRELIYEECGIHLKESKRSMMSARLFKRLRALGLESFSDYHAHVSRAGDRLKEIASMIDVITTNKTDFFREPNHFDFLVEQALPALEKLPRFARHRKVNVWSAGCSTGEEPYTLAMVLAEYFHQRDGDFAILATDISTRVLAAARAAVYAQELLAPVPAPLKRKYVMQGRGARAGQCRIVPELRKKVTLGRLNFMEEDYGFEAAQDVIFCRNVIIYFDWETKVNVIRKLAASLAPGGYLFVGHSETLNGVDVDLRRIIPTVFRKPL